MKNYENCCSSRMKKNININANIIDEWQTLSFEERKATDNNPGLFYILYRL